MKRKEFDSPNFVFPLLFNTSDELIVVNPLTIYTTVEAKGLFLKRINKQRTWFSTAFTI
jgi:hypothetical protein